MAPTKRAAATEHAEGPLCKRAKEFMKEDGVPQKDIKAVLEAIEQHAEVLPENCRRMLSATLPFGLGVGSDKRTEHQNMVVDMIGDVLSQISANLAAAVDGERQKVKEIGESKLSRESKVAEMESLLAIDVEQSAMNKKALVEAGTSKKQKEVALNAAKQEERNGNAALDGAETEKGQFQSVLDVDLKALCGDESLAAASLKKHQQSIATLLKKMKADESLITALPTVCQKKSAERGPFDTMVLEQIEQTLCGKVSQLDAMIASGAADREARAASVSAAQADVDVATASLLEATEKYKTSQANEQAASENMKAAKSAVANFENEQKVVGEGCDAKEAEFQRFKDHNLATFTELRDRVSKELQKQQAAEKAAAEAAAAAAEKAAAAAEAAEAERLAAAAAAEAEAQKQAAAAAEAAEAERLAAAAAAEAEAQKQAAAAAAEAEAEQAAAAASAAAEEKDAAMAVEEAAPVEELATVDEKVEEPSGGLLESA